MKYIKTSKVRFKNILIMYNMREIKPGGWSPKDPPGRGLKTVGNMVHCVQSVTLTRTKSFRYRIVVQPIIGAAR